MKPVIRVDRLAKRFGQQVALDQVSFEVPPGVVFALLGENGAGKTTAIRILLGMAQADAGQATVLGLDSRREGLEVRRRVGYVPERPTLYEWMTVREAGWFASGFYGDGFLDRYQALTESFGLDPRKKVKQLSKGTRAKVALSLAMAHDPDLLILDEPTSGLDPLVRRDFLSSMIDRAASGKTVLLSSHQISEVERVADIVGILRHGHLVLVERLDTLKEEVHAITITLAGDAGLPPVLSERILRQQQRGRQLQLLTRGATEDELTSLRGHAAVSAVDARRPTLEEIFVAYMLGQMPQERQSAAGAVSDKEQSAR